MKDQGTEGPGPGSQPEQAEPSGPGSALPSKGKVGDQTQFEVVAARDAKKPVPPLFSDSERAILLSIEPPFHDSSSNQAVVKALEAAAAARLNLFTQVDQALLDVHQAKG